MKTTKSSFIETILKGTELLGNAAIIWFILVALSGLAVDEAKGQTLESGAVTSIQISIVPAPCQSNGK